MNKLIPLPFFVLTAVIAFNVTAFTIMLQMDLLIFNSLTAKIISWIVTAGSWGLVYIYRNR